MFKFLELHEKVGFQDAVQMLAQKFGVPLPGADGAATMRAARRRRCAKRCSRCTRSRPRTSASSSPAPAGARARAAAAASAASRAQTIEQLGLGYAPPVARRPEGAAARSRASPQALLLQSGLVVQRDDGEVVDRFRNRLMVPICRDTGSVIAFGGRAMDADQEPKYLNSPETPIYSKGRTLYGLNLTKAAIRKLGFAVLVEGYFDFAQVFQAQAAPVVASCGTALTPQQAQLLRRFTSKVVLSFDPDAAGQGAAVRSCELLVARASTSTSSVLDKGEDPDTFIRQQRPRRATASGCERRGRIWSTCSTRRRPGSISDTTTAGGSSWARCWRSRPGSPTPRPATSSRTGSPTRRGLRKRSSGRRSARRPSSGRPTLTDRELPAFGQLKHAEKGLIWGLIHKPARRWRRWPSWTTRT